MVQNAHSTADVQQAAARASEQESAAEVIAAAKARFEEPRGLLEQIRLAGTDLRPSLTAGIAAVGTIDLGTARAKAELITMTLANAAGQGQMRAGIAVGIVLMAAVAFLLVWRRRRAGRLARASMNVAPTVAVAESISPSSLMVGRDDVGATAAGDPGPSTANVADGSEPAQDGS